MEEQRRCYDLYLGDPAHDCDRCEYRQKHRLLYVDIGTECHEYRKTGKQTACKISCDKCGYFTGEKGE